MADYRLFSRAICDSGRFLRLPLSSQCLYYRLVLHADDDGVVETFGMMRMANSTEDDINVLVARGFLEVLSEEDQVMIIAHWNLHNKGGYLRSDRRKPSIYRDLIRQKFPDYELPDIKHRADTTKNDDLVDVHWTSSGQPSGRPKNKKNNNINNNKKGGRPYNFNDLEAQLLAAKPVSVPR